MSRPDYTALAEVLEKMNKEGEFTASILSSENGLLLASAVSPTTNREIVAAMSGYVTSTVDRMRGDLELGELKDIAVRCSAGKAVFRKIASMEGQSLILAALMPRKVRYHSRALGKAATKIRKILGYKR